MFQNNEIEKNDIKSQTIKEGDSKKWKELRNIPDRISENDKVEQDTREIESKNQLAQKLNENRTQSMEKLYGILDNRGIEKSMDRSYSSLMGDVKEHSEKARKFERQANELETDIRRGKVGKEKMQEVRQLRRKAEMEKMEAEKCKSLAKETLLLESYGTMKLDDLEINDDEALNKESNISFTGNGPCARQCLKSKVVVGFHA